MLQELTIVRILIVDDSEGDFIVTKELILQTISHQWIIDWCNNYKDTLEFIYKRMYDIYIIDHYLGNQTGVDILKEALSFKCEEPIILLTGNGNKSIELEAMQYGAADYLVKAELNPTIVERCIRYTLERYSNIKALRTNERKYRKIFEHSKDAVFISDENFKFKDVNYATTILFEYNKEELLHMTFYDLIADIAEIDFLNKYLDKNEEINDKEIELKSKLGNKKKCTLSFSKEIDLTGQIYIQAIIHDISNLKRAEKITLQAEKLSAAGRLVRTLAHEVRNPLNNISLSVEQLNQEINNKELQVYFEIINRNSNRISALITELLDSSRPTEIILEKNILQKIIDESITAASDRINLKHIIIHIDYPNEPILIMADAEKLKIAFLNLIINAIEAVEEGNGELHILVESHLSKYQVTIKDNGCGVLPENLSRVFEPYFTSKKNGLGLGLAATLNIIKSHKAIIDFYSLPHQGTTFIIDFEKIPNSI